MRTTHRPTTVAALLLSLFMGAMEMTVVSTAMPTVVADLGGIEFYGWVFAAYMLASTVSVPIYGKLADLLGRKPVMLFGISLFLVGSAASGAAHSMGQLIAFRALQGLGAGAMQPIALTIVGDLFTMEERARMQGMFGAVWGLAGIVGPVLGGYIVKALSWRWVFYINLPFGLAALALLSLALHEKVERKAHRLDIPGALLLALGIVALLAASHGGGMGLGSLALAVVLLAAFVVVERRAQEPVVPLDLFGQRTILVSCIAGALVGASMISTVTYVPLFVQGVLAGSPTDGARAITPMVIGWPIASAVSGRLLARVGFRPLVRLGLFLAALAAAGLALFLEPGVSLHVPQALTCLFGVGLGLANTALLIAVQSSVAWNRRGVATASTMFFRTIGGTLAVGSLGAILSHVLTRDPTLPAHAADDLLGPEHGRALDPQVLHALSGALAQGLDSVFWIVCAIAAGAFVTSLFFPAVVAKAAPPADKLGSAPMDSDVLSPEG